MFLKMFDWCPCCVLCEEVCCKVQRAGHGLNLGSLQELKWTLLILLWLQSPYSSHKLDEVSMLQIGHEHCHLVSLHCYTNTCCVGVDYLISKPESHSKTLVYVYWVVILNNCYVTWCRKLCIGVKRATTHCHETYFWALDFCIISVTTLAHQCLSTLRISEWILTHQHKMDVCWRRWCLYNTTLAKLLLNESTLECSTLLIKELVVGLKP